MAPASRRRNMMGIRRRVGDEGDNDGRPDRLEADDGSVAVGTQATDGRGCPAAGDTSNTEEASRPSTAVHHASNGSANPSNNRQLQSKSAPSLASSQAAERPNPSPNGQTQQQQTPTQANDDVLPSRPKSPSAPVIVSSASAMNPAIQDANARRRNESDEYRRRRDQDPSFVPNRGAFFMHDSRQPGGTLGSALRPFSRGRGRGGRGGYLGNGYGRINQMYQAADPTTDSQWTHDMHDATSHPHSRRQRQASAGEGLPNGNGYIPTCNESETPINRTLSTEKDIGRAQVRVYLPTMKEPVAFKMLVKQYTKLPDHRPPLRRDKAVRISLPERAPRYIFPAPDRSFTFIPRALRPNQQQRMRGKPRSAFGSIGGFSHQTSIFGGSQYGSMYTPSNNVSRRSSIVYDREFIFSPTGSNMSRAPHPSDSRPVVRLPPPQRMDMVMPDIGAQFGPAVPAQEMPAAGRVEGPVVDGQPVSALPMHQPRPQKNISVAHIESPTASQGSGQSQPFQQAFHQQMPMHVGGGYQHDGHSRRQSFHSQRVSGTPLSHIPERSVHAAPFNPTAYPQQGYYQGAPQPLQHGYYHQGGYAGTGTNGPASGYPSNAPSPMTSNYAMQGQMEQPAAQGGGQAGQSNVVVQEVNGMMYYYNTSQVPPPTTYAPYPSTQSYPTSSMGMQGMMTPSPDAFYYPQAAPSMLYYPQ